MLGHIRTIIVEMINERASMRKLLLIALAITGLGLILAPRSDAQSTTTVLVPRTEGLSFGFPSGYYGSPRYLNYYPLRVLRASVRSLLSLCRESVFILFRAPKLQLQWAPDVPPPASAPLSPQPVGLIKGSEIRTLLGRNSASKGNFSAFFSSASGTGRPCASESELEGKRCDLQMHRSAPARSRTPPGTNKKGNSK